MNQVVVTVEQNPAVSAYTTVNQPYVTVRICDASNNCQNIDHVMVDTGSYGLRLFASAVTLNLQPETTTPSGGGSQPVGECASFVSSYTWGPVRKATVMLNGESAASIPVQIIADSTFASVPTSCSNNAGPSISTVQDLGANGILGVGLFKHDGGSYYACSGSSGTSCVSVTLAASSQVVNPVAAFSSADNNGVILSLPSVPATGQQSATGTLTFGLDTQADNALAGFSIVPADSSGYISSNFNHQAFTQTYIDSGSNFNFLILTGGYPTDSNGNYTPPNPVSFPMSLSSPVSANSASSVFYLDPQPQSFTFNAYPGLASNYGVVLSSQADLGASWLYGHSVAYAINGNTLVEGTAPFYGFQ
uniref:DUF3443 family protein n=1 Tax=mine drainage metagenome TaxID=410659 RepID=E6QSZ8_9ZZZZ